MTDGRDAVRLRNDAPFQLVSGSALRRKAAGVEEEEFG
jgi:hypothetical protein